MNKKIMLCWLCFLMICTLSSCSVVRTVSAYKDFSYSKLVRYKENRDYDGMKALFSAEIVSKLGEEEFERECTVFFDWNREDIGFFHQYSYSDGGDGYYSPLYYDIEVYYWGSWGFDYPSNYTTSSRNGYSMNFVLYESSVGSAKNNGLIYIWLRTSGTEKPSWYEDKRYGLHCEGEW